MKKNQIPTYDFREFLRETLEKRVRQNQAYSLRAFARSLKIDASALAKLLNGKRPMGNTLIQKLGSALGLPETEIKKYLGAKKARKKLGTEKTDPITAKYRLLTLEELKLVSNWYDYAVLELMDIPGFQIDVNWIAKCLKFSSEKISESVENLKKVGLISQTPHGKWVKLHAQTTVKPSEEESRAVRERLIRSIMQNAVNALNTVSSEKRSHTAMTFAADSSLLPEAVEKIRAFRVELETFLNQSKKRDQVYQLAVALYPLSYFDA